MYLLAAYRDKDKDFLTNPLVQATGPLGPGEIVSPFTLQDPLFVDMAHRLGQHGGKKGVQMVNIMQEYFLPGVPLLACPPNPG